MVRSTDSASRIDLADLSTSCTLPGRPADTPSQSLGMETQPMGMHATVSVRATVRELIASRA